jgi:hypothetical protein
LFALDFCKLSPILCESSLKICVTCSNGIESKIPTSAREESSHERKSDKAAANELHIS